MTPAPLSSNTSIPRYARCVRLAGTALLPFFLICTALAQTPPPASSPAKAQPIAAPTPSESKPTSLPPIPKRQLQAAEDAYLDGARLVDHKDFAAAEIRFADAVKQNPRNTDYILALAVTRQNRVAELVQQAGKARLLGHAAAADSLLAAASTLDPHNTLVTQHLDPAPSSSSFSPLVSAASSPGLIDTDSPEEDPVHQAKVAYAGAITLIPTGHHESFHLHQDVQQVVSRVAGSFGIRAVFDPSVTSQSVRFDLDDTTYDQAMPILLEMGRLFAVPLDAHSILVAKNTLDNRQRLERQLQETIYLPALTTEQLTELSNVIRNVFDIRQVTVQNSIGSIVIRAPESILSALNRTVSDLVDGGSEVELDLKLYAVDRSVTRNLGAQLPQQAGIYNVDNAASNLVAANQTLVNQAIADGLITAGASNISIALALIASGLVKSTLLSSTVGFFGGGITTTGLTTNVNPTFSLALNSSDTRALDDITLRIGDHQSATFRVGSRYPITTSTYAYSSAASSALSGVTVNGVSVSSLLSSVSTATVPQIQYEDLGITLKATPIVQKSNNVTVNVDLKIEALAGTSLDNIPVLASRQFTSGFTIEDGHTAMLVSSLTKSESNAVSGLPGLAELPGFQSTVSDQSVQQDSSELLLLITPHIVRRRSGTIAGPRIAISLPPSSD